ncbi:MAG TPA: DNA topoisomerase IB [Solirubrobacterales bacterium]|nr:DNA topoisomerase IB [Solirubrobacterales bacterium]
MPRTRRVDCTDPGLHRVRRGRGFSYHEEDGSRVADPEVIARIEDLAIPPAWKEVWICSDDRGHIQATGIDAAGRKQYRYHDDWRTHRDREKFERMFDFARRLPKLRERYEAGLGGRGVGLERVSAAAVALLDMGLFRIGSERYEEENESYGLTTLKVHHVSFAGEGAEFEYPAKSGQLSRHRISDPAVVAVLRSLTRRRDGDDDLLSYRDGRERSTLTPEQVNGWIKETLGEPFSAKDFRTWNATVLAAIVLARHAGEATTKSARKRLAARTAREVADQLNNTPAVCRTSYIDPRVFDRYDAGETIAGPLKRLERRRSPGEFVERDAIERAVVRLLAGR